MFTEAIVTPVSWDDWPAAAGIFRALRSEVGERLVLEDNVFVERILPASVLRELGETEMAVYRRRFTAAASPRPVSRVGRR